MVKAADLPHELQGRGVQLFGWRRGRARFSQDFNASAQSCLLPRNSIIIEFWVPVAAALRRHVENIPDRRQQVDSAVELFPHHGSGGIEVPDAIRRANENA